MKNFLAIGIVLVLLVGACKKSASSDKRVEEINTEGGVSEIIRNPVSADGMLDSTKVAKLTFLETTYDFGEIQEGEVAEHVFQFTNTGKVPLIISDARSTCGCTVPEWSKEPILPGENSEIKVRFNSTNKSGQQNKPVTITANTYPAETIVYIKGFVREKNT
jgi:hypothetical protein